MGSHAVLLGLFAALLCSSPQPVWMEGLTSGSHTCHSTLSGFPEATSSENIKPLERQEQEIIAQKTIPLVLKRKFGD